MSENMYVRSRLSFIGIFLFYRRVFVSAQTKNPIYLDYINKYKDIAIDHQKRYKIPASITLAQGLLESAAGTSELARKSNNHFGIKCHNSWEGKRVYHDDDEKGECFRKYRNPKESYEDHALFLTKSSRYEKLFKLDITDYKGWAHGLKRCGLRHRQGLCQQADTDHRALWPPSLRRKGIAPNAQRL